MNNNITEKFQVAPIVFNNKNMMSLTLDSRQGIKLEDVLTTIKENNRIKNMEKAFKKKNKTDELEYMITLKIPDGYRSSSFNTIDDLELPSGIDDFADSCYIFKDDNFKNYSIHHINIYMRQKAKRQGGDDNKNNDCFYDCLYKLYNGKLPNGIKRASN